MNNLYQAFKKKFTILFVALGGVVRCSYILFIQPKAQQEDDARRELILNILLVGSITLLCIINIIIFYRLLTAPHRFAFFTMIPLFVLLIFLILFSLVRRRKIYIASLGLLLIYFVSISYAIFFWGADLPQAVLSYVLIIIMASVLISTRFGFIATGVIAVTILLAGFLQEYGYINPSLLWRRQLLRTDDLMIFVVTYLFVMLVSWLSNREIERSLKRARQSEKELKQERDLLEYKVEERTQELKKAQLERVGELYRFAEFGRLASGLFHDLINPLSAVVLSAQELERKRPDFMDVQKQLDHTLDATRKMESFIEALRKELSHQSTQAQFSLNKEIEQVIQLFGYKARIAGVNIQFNNAEDVQAYGNQLKFHQIVANLVSNAIDSYISLDRSVPRRREVIVSLSKHHTIARLVVTDFGAGIPPDILSKIFEPFYTTKPEGVGSGIGLSTTKYLVEKDFSGQIHVETNMHQGTTFIVEFAV